MRRSLLPLAMLVAVLAHARGAGAYCRTTTVEIPPGYDPTVQGCVTEGTPIAWASMPVTYELNQAASVQISFAAATPIFDAAFAAWREVSCPAAGGAAGHPSLSFDTLAPTDAQFVQCGVDAQTCEQAEAVGPHQIIFRDDAWPYDDSANTIALTTVTYGVDDAHILSANMEINSHDFQLSTAEPPAAGDIALAAIARHEAGHFIGLAHSQTSAAAMYAFYSPDMTSLTQDDIDGVCAAYPPSASGCSCSVPHGTEGALGVGGVAVAVATAARRRRRSPRGVRACRRSAPRPA